MGIALVWAVLMPGFIPEPIGEHTMSLNQGDFIFLRGLVSEKESQLRTLIVNAVEAGEVARAKHMVESLRDFEGLHGRVQEEVRALEGKVVIPVAAPAPVAPAKPVQPVAAFNLPTRASKSAPAADTAM
jgi:hypothetical protein